jgi:bifunctional ADP-heptose synthase (sugar kinase/adenylyltransferase)
MYQNRKERRKYEKSFGLFKKKKKMTEKEYNEQQRKKILLGIQLEKEFEDNTENAILLQKADKESKMIEHFVISGYTEDEAKEIINRNRQIEEKRKEKLSKRKK